MRETEEEFLQNPHSSYKFPAWVKGIKVKDRVKKHPYLAIGFKFDFDKKEEQEKEKLYSIDRTNGRTKLT